MSTSSLICVSLFSCLSFLFEIRASTCNALHMSLNPFIVFIFIKVYTKSCHSTIPSDSPVISTISWTERPKLRVNVLSAFGNTGFLSPEIVTDAQSIFPKSRVQVRNNRPRTLFPRIISLKNFHVSVGVMPLFAYDFITGWERTVHST